MQKFMLFIREDLDALKEISVEENERGLQLMLQWVEELSKTGNFISGEPLEPEVRYVKKDKIFHDGPHIESKEAVSGYLLIKAESIQQASDIAQRCPLLGDVVKAIEVRPVVSV